MPNAFVHVGLNAADVAQIKAFYGKLFDWTLEDIPMGETGYTLIKVGKGTGLRRHYEAPGPSGSSYWLAYVEVSDIHAATENVTSLGAPR